MADTFPIKRTVAATADGPLHAEPSGSTWRVSARPPCRVHLAVQAVGRADEGEVRERLRKVAEVLAARAQLLGVEAEVVGIAERLLEDEPRLVDVARARQRLDVPERAHAERTLLFQQAVRCRVARAV